MRSQSLATVFLGLGMVLTGAAWAAESKAGGEKTVAGETVILQMVNGLGKTYEGNIIGENKGTFWRYFETWQSDLVRTKDGKLVHVDPFNPRADYDFSKKGGKEQNKQSVDIPILEAGKVMGSAFPPPDWMKPDFDDSAWFRTSNPMQMAYRSLAMICVRGKFMVDDPGQVKDVTLKGAIQGGAVFFVNGQEVGRHCMPAGKIDNETPADDYPMDAFVTSAGELLPQRGSEDSASWKGSGGGEFPMTEAQISGGGKVNVNADIIARYKSRFRHFNVNIPSSVLKKGVNVVAIEVHRAPAAEAMYSHVNTRTMMFNLGDHYASFWNRTGVEELLLTTKSAGAEANVARPAGIQVWNWPLTERVTPDMYGDPCEKLAPIRLNGARNGAFSGQLIVSSTEAIKGLQVEVSDLTSKAGQKLAKSQVQVRALQSIAGGRGIPFESLEESLPAEVLVATPRNGKPAAVQPIWITVNVPKTAAAGDYTGTVKVSAAGLAPVTTPVELHVSDFPIADPPDCKLYMAFIESPDTLAIRYNVPMWSEAHWKLIDKCFHILGAMGCKDITVTLVRRTHFGNDHGLVWFVKKTDGTYEPYFDNVERYIDTAVKNMGKLPVVSFYVLEEDADKCPWVSEFDPATGALKDIRAPSWGTPEAAAFWKPVFDGFYKILAKHGIEKSLFMATHAKSGGGPEPSKECIDTLKDVAPKAGWVKLAHTWGNHGPEKLESGPGGNPWGRVALVAGNYGVLWDPETEKPFFGWHNPYPVTMYTRSVFTDASPLKQYRMGPEMILFGGRRKRAAGSSTLCDIGAQFGESFLGCKGFGPWGADFWPVLGTGQRSTDIIHRFGGSDDPRSYWYTVSLNGGQTPYVVGDGANGPVFTVRGELFRQSMQDSEAHILCEDALNDEKLRAKLSPDLAKRCKEACDRRLQALRYESTFTFFGTAKDPAYTHFEFNADQWHRLSKEIFDVAAEVSKALGK